MRMEMDGAGTGDRGGLRESGQRFLIVGLGNPGPEYLGNRHNVGFQVVDRLAESLGVRFAAQSRLGLVARATIAGWPVVLQKPRTYMNLSGEAVGAAVSWYKVDVGRCLLVVMDDLDLFTGRVRLRPRGGAGGHKGIRSIIDSLRTQDFSRLRVGIGRPARGDPVDYVLGDFTRSEQDLMSMARETAGEAVCVFVESGIVAAMNRFNAEVER